jgi:hypothetical protein
MQYALDDRMFFCTDLSAHFPFLFFRVDVEAFVFEKAEFALFHAINFLWATAVGRINGIHRRDTYVFDDLITRFVH